MHFETETIRLNLIHPFRIAREVSDHKNNVLIHLSDGDFTAVGEAAPSQYYGESARTVLQALAALPSILTDVQFDLQEPLVRLNDRIPGNPSARAAVDIALHDLAAQQQGMPMRQWLGISSNQTPPTSFTIGIDEPSMICQKVREADGYHALKIKMGSKNDLETMRIIRNETQTPVRIDANAGWTVDQAVEMVQLLEEYGVELVEQCLI